MEDFFERTVLRSGSGGSEFNPQTFTMHLYGPYSDTQFESVTLHELIHWIQFIAYTFGGFQSALIHIRDEYTKRILSKYFWSKDKFRDPVRFSVPENMQAFFNPKFDYEGMKEHIWIEENIWPDQHFWRDALICEKLFLNLSKYFDVGKGYKGVSLEHGWMLPEFLIPRIMQRINNWALDTLCYKSTETKRYLELTDYSMLPMLSNFGRAMHAGIELDTSDIIEGMSVAFEVYMLQTEETEEHARQRMKQVTNTDYARAIEVFLEIMEFSVQPNDVARMALLFLAIAEMSLNPPLPPFGIINKLELDWNKIYPPLRFIELCQIAKRLVSARGYTLGNPITWIFDWIATVEALYLAQGGVFSYLAKDKDGYLPKEKSVPFLALIAEEEQVIREILRLKGVNTVGMMEKFTEILENCTGLELYAMLRHVHILFINHFRTPRPFLIPLDLRTDKSNLSFPPLIFYEDDTTMIAWSKEVAYYLTEFNLYKYPLHDIMLGRKPHLYLPNHPIIDEERRKKQQERFSGIF